MVTIKNYTDEFYMIKDRSKLNQGTWNFECLQRVIELHPEYAVMIDIFRDWAKNNMRIDDILFKCIRNRDIFEMSGACSIGGCNNDLIFYIDKNQIEDCEMDKLPISKPTEYFPKPYLFVRCDHPNNYEDEDDDEEEDWDE